MKFGLKELIERKKLALEANRSRMVQDAGGCTESSPQSERLKALLLDARSRRDAELTAELEVLTAADNALTSVLALAENNTTKHSDSVFNRIWNEANKPYAVKK